MKGVILAGGTGSRLYPLTKSTNKCLLPIATKPMVYHVLELMTSSGIDDIMLITGPENAGQVMNLLGSGLDYSCSLTYRIQDKANGIAAAVNLCKSFVGNSKFTVLLGDNIFSDFSKLASQIREFYSSKDEFRLFLKEVIDPQRFGVPIYLNDEVVDIIEKPKSPPSNKAIVGLYCYSSNVFDVIEGLKPSSRGEYEISELNSYLVKNCSGSFFDVECEWVDAGTHESYKKANEMIWETLK
jgi:glucose-1-phosphate thymidylyltransferase